MDMENSINLYCSNIVAWRLKRTSGNPQVDLGTS